MDTYSPHFYTTITESAEDSARIVVPLVFELLHPKSVVDVGCGAGAWLRAFSEQGVARVVGLDLPHFSQHQLLIPKEDYHACNLLDAPPALGRFDLVVSLEVAEHLPASHAGAFVATLVGYGDAVLFSAAIPHQPGTHHVNCQWPQFWVNHFLTHNYVLVDCLRPRLWNNPQVASWYAQNLLLFIERTSLGKNAALFAESDRTPAMPLAVVHPRMLEDIVNALSPTLSGLIKSIPVVILQSIRYRFRWK